MTDIEITVRELAARWQAGEHPPLLDVREAWEFEHAHLPGAAWVPLAELPGRLAAFLEAAPAELICYCHHGHRSLLAADWLRRAGLPGARSLAGGVDAWAREVDPAFPRY